MRDEFSKHRCRGQECRRLLEAAEKTVSPSFLCLGFVVSQSLSVERLVCFAGQSVLCVVCVVVRVNNITCPHCSQYFCNIIIIIIIIIFILTVGLTSTSREILSITTFNPICLVLHQVQKHRTNSTAENVW